MFVTFRTGRALYNSIPSSRTWEGSHPGSQSLKGCLWKAKASSCGLASGRIPMENQSAT